MEDTNFNFDSILGQVQEYDKSAAAASVPLTERDRAFLDNVKSHPAFAPFRKTGGFVKLPMSALDETKRISAVEYLQGMGFTTAGIYKKKASKDGKNQAAWIFSNPEIKRTRKTNAPAETEEQ